jgi:chorismate dehydratase
MVYAVWAVNRGFVETRSELCEHIFELFKKSMNYSMSHFSEIAGYAAKWEPFSPTMLEKYFRSLRFDFGTEYQEGLLQFYKMAADSGELESIPELAFIHLASGATV